jgi:hypothetical protein
LGFEATPQPAGTLFDMRTTTVTEASAAIQRVDAALQSIATQRARVGATLSRFDSLIGDLNTAGSNLTASRSRILDADYAAETAALTRTQIIQQAGQAMLAQANTNPRLILALLRSALVVQEVGILLAHGLSLLAQCGLLHTDVGLLRAERAEALGDLRAHAKLLTSQVANTCCKALAKLGLLPVDVGLLPSQIAVQARQACLLTREVALQPCCALAKLSLLQGLLTVETANALQCLGLLQRLSLLRLTKLALHACCALQALRL